MNSKLEHVGISTRAWALKVRRTCFFHEEDPSTNLWARQDSTITESPVIYLTNHQSEGRGRGSNTWQNPPPGDSLLASWKFQLTQSVRHIASPVIGLALYEAANQTWPTLPWSLKAPNDLYLGSKKVAGLLVESVMQGSKNTLIIGIGLNVLSSPSDLETATSITENCMGDSYVSVGQWHSFLSTIDEKWSSCLPTVTSGALAPDVRTRLREALNKNPNLKEKILEISPQGDLTTASGSTSWKDV